MIISKNPSLASKLAKPFGALVWMANNNCIYEMDK